MDQGVSALKIASVLARHASHAHAVTSNNIAKADVPGATAARVASFEKSLKRLDQGNDPFTLDTGQLISVEREMLSMAEAGGRHSAALSIWKSTLNMMRLAVTPPQ